MGPRKNLIRAVLDTNVLVSVLLFRGHLERIREDWREGRLRQVACRETLDEIVRVLAYPKFRLSNKEIHFLLRNEILPFTDVVDISGRTESYCRDPKDDIFIRCALAGRCNWLMSGDHDLLVLRQVKEVEIVDPGTFLTFLLKP